MRSIVSIKKTNYTTYFANNTGFMKIANYQPLERGTILVLFK